MLADLNGFIEKKAKSLILLLRPPYWLMTGGLSVLTMFTLQKGLPDTTLLALVVLSVICIIQGASHLMITLIKNQML
jgi:hypothetical protein